MDGEIRYIKRIVEKQIINSLELYGAVCLNGPKYCGKTSTSMNYCRSGFEVGNPANNYNNKALTNLSPSSVLVGETPRLIVEWEEAPILWNTVNEECENRFKKGQFIMTNSYWPKVDRNSSESVCNIKMRTMTLYETGDSSGDISLEDVCNGRIEQTFTGDVDLLRLAYYVTRGGWPNNLVEPAEKLGSIMRAYVKEIIKDDVEKFDGKKYDVDKMMLLINSLAQNEGTIATNTKLLKDIKAINKSVDINTITTYIDIFERCNLTDNQLAFSKDIGAPLRLKQTDRRRFADPSIPCALLGLKPQNLIANIKLFNRLFKSLCVHDLKVYAESFGAEVSYYEDYGCNEIDAVIELPNGKWCAFDIRMGTNEIDRAAKELLQIKQDILANGGIIPSELCVISAMSNMAYKRKDGVMVVPLTALKN